MHNCAVQRHVEVTGSRVEGQDRHALPNSVGQPLRSMADDSSAAPGELRGHSWAGVRHGARGSHLIADFDVKRRRLWVSCRVETYKHNLVGKILPEMINVIATVLT